MRTARNERRRARLPELEQAYEAAWEEWTTSDEDAVWSAAATDGESAITRWPDAESQAGVAGHTAPQGLATDGWGDKNRSRLCKQIPENNAWPDLVGKGRC